MSFKTNDCQQLSLDDSFTALTERERKALEKSCPHHEVSHSHSIFYGNDSGFCLISAVLQSLWYAKRIEGGDQASDSQRFHHQNNQKVP